MFITRWPKRNFCVAHKDFSEVCQNVFNNLESHFLFIVFKMKLTQLYIIKINDAAENLTNFSGLSTLYSIPTVIISAKLKLVRQSL
jgi:hypothetical protein